MTIQKSIVMMTNTGNNYDVVSEPYRADGFWGYSDGLHTVSASVQNLKGNLRLQATLSTSPQEKDWFDIDINPKDHRIPWIEFDGQSSVEGFSFIGNFVFIRAILDRSNRIDLEPDINGKAFLEQGQIDRILLVM